MIAFKWVDFAFSCSTSKDNELFHDFMFIIVFIGCWYFCTAMRKWVRETNRRVVAGLFGSIRCWFPLSSSSQVCVFVYCVSSMERLRAENPQPLPIHLIIPRAHPIHSRTRTGSTMTASVDGRASGRLTRSTHDASGCGETSLELKAIGWIENCLRG